MRVFVAGATGAIGSRLVPQLVAAGHPDPPKAQRRTLDAIRHVEKAVTDSPLEGVVLRYGIFYGPGSSDEMLDLVRKRRMPVVGDGGGIWSMLHLDDAASATVAALER